jgi:class 3 adenylate cyclase
MAVRRKIGTSASEDRLEQLMGLRQEQGADKARIDKRIWDLFGERWAVMFTDLSGFSRNVADFGIIQFLQTIFESQRILIPIIDEYDGILLKVEGDSFLVIFRNPEKAAACAVSMQKALTDYNKKLPAAEKILLCVGIGYGDILKIGDADVFGEEVNSASKLGEDVAKAGEIYITDPLKGAIEKGGLAVTPATDLPSGVKKAWKVAY